MPDARREIEKLREEIRALDTDIMHEEASLGDFKRSTVKYWMGIKFGDLMECCEKGMVREMVSCTAVIN